MEKNNTEEKEEEITLEEYLVYSGRCGDLEGIALCIEEKIDLNTKDEHKNTALHMACANGHENVVKVLVDAGAKVDVLNESNNTPLHWAAFNGHAGIVKLLLEKGANPNAKNEFGRTPLDEAMVNEKEEVADLLMAKMDIPAEEPAAKVPEEDEEEIEEEKAQINATTKEQSQQEAESENIKKLEEELMKQFQALDPTAEVKVTKSPTDKPPASEDKKK